MNKLTSIILWLVVGYLFTWIIQFTYEQNAPKKGKDTLITSIMANEQNVRAALGGDTPNVMLTKESKEAQVNKGDIISITLNQDVTGPKWTYESDDQQAFEILLNDFNDPDATNQVWGFRAIKHGEKHLYFKKGNESLTFKITIK